MVQSQSITHGVVKVHVVGDDVDVGVEDVVLVNHLLQDVSNPGRKYHQRDLVLRQAVEEHFVPVPEGTQGTSDTLNNELSI